MVSWCSIPEGTKKPIEEVPDAVAEEPIAIYASRYSLSESELATDAYEILQRYIDEIISEFDVECSVLLFGSGHSSHANRYYACENVKSVDALDFVSEAGLGLHPDIGFFQLDILQEEIPKTYDYVFSTHTIEHFTRSQVLDIVIPKLRRVARKAVVILTPYANNWGTEPSHRCRFYEDDELAGLASKYKRIRNSPSEGLAGMEIVYWLEGHAANENKG